MSEQFPEQAAQANYVTAALGFFAQMGPAEAIVHEDRRYTYAQVRAAVLAMAAALRTHGVRGGMNVVAVTKNHPESIILQLAMHLLGCRTGFVATYAPLRDQRDFISYADPDVLIHDSGLANGMIREALADLGRPALPVLSLGPEDGHPDLLAEMAAAADAAPRLEDALGGTATAAEPQSLFYTSGTTGQPKLVLHRQRFHQALFAGGQFYRASGEPPMRHLATQEFSTTSGQMPGLLALFQGGAAILATGLAIHEFLALIEQERVTSTFVSPLRLRELLAAPALASTDCSSLRYLNCGGSAAAPDVLAEAARRLGPVVRIVYGMTELPLIADYPFLDTDPAHPQRLRSCGTPFADTQIEIRDEHGKPLPAGATGQVWVTGTLLMDSYFRQPELTAQAVVDGWLDTGDIGYRDDDGFLYLVDRSKDMVITGKRCLKIYSRVVEDVLVSHPAAAMAAVIGVPDDDLGEAVHAFVVPAPGATVTAAALRALVTRELDDEDFAPRAVEFVAELPLTPMDKVDKQALRARYLGRPEPFPFRLAPEDRGTPARLYARRRQGGAPDRVKLPSGDMAHWVIDYDEVSLVLRDRRFSRNFRYPGAPRMVAEGDLSLVPDAIVNVDPPEHTRLRRIVQSAFRPGHEQQWGPVVTNIVGQLLDTIEAAGPPADLVANFASLLPIRVICDLLDVSPDDQRRLISWTGIFFSTSTASQADRAAANQEFISYVLQLIAAHRATPGTGLVDELIRSRDVDGALTEPELLQMIVAMFIGGQENTSATLARGIFALLRQPASYEALCADPGLVATAVEEILRYELPTEGAFLRVTTEDVKLPSGAIPRGRAVQASLAAANRDPAHFPDAERFDIRRDPNPHLAFGAGPHFCVGAPLARLELRTALGVLTARFPGLRLATGQQEAEFAGDTLVRALRTLPVTW